MDAVWFTLAMGFALLLRPLRGKEEALEYLTGYLIELSLSMDNVFVIALIFGYFRIPPQYQHRVLFWGILGALIMRGAMIWAGVALISALSCILYLFGIFLVYSGIKMMFVDTEVDPEENPVLIEVLVVGAGINGIGTFRDLALNDTDVLLVDRADFCSGASAASSHMAHGGIRYLENGEFRLVREAVRERNLMIENAPHIVRPLPTTIPIFRLFSGILNAPLKCLGLLDRPSERGTDDGRFLRDWQTAADGRCAFEGHRFRQVHGRPGGAGDAVRAHPALAARACTHSRD